MPAGTYAIGASAAQWALDESVAQEVAQLRTEIGLLAKQIAARDAKKVHAVGAQGKSARHDDSESDEEAKYLDREVAGFQAKGQGYNHDSWNSRQGNQGRNCSGDNYNKSGNRD